MSNIYPISLFKSLFCLLNLNQYCFFLFIFLLLHCVNQYFILHPDLAHGFFLMFLSMFCCRFVFVCLFVLSLTPLLSYYRSLPPSSKINYMQWLLLSYECSVLAWLISTQLSTFSFWTFSFLTSMSYFHSDSVADCVAGYLAPISSSLSSLFP